MRVQETRQGGMVGLTEGISRFVVETARSKIDDDVREYARMSLADTVGVIIAGSASEVGPPLVQYAAQCGTGPAPVLGTGVSVAPSVSALVNGTFGHALDFDDVVSIMPGHPSAVMLAALIPEAIGNHGNIDLLDPYIIGVEVAAKLGVGTGLGHYNRGWHTSGTIGIFGAVAALASARGLTCDTTRQALGIAASMTSGIQRNFGTMTKPLHTGWAAHSAREAVDLAVAGISAATDGLEGPRGFLDVYGDSDSSSEKVLTALGAPYVFLDPGMSLKKYPCCYALHRPIDALLELRGRYDVRPQTVERVRICVPPGAMRPLIFPSPETGLEAKFSMQYVLARGIVNGRFGLREFTDAAVQESEIRDLLPRMLVSEDESCFPADGSGRSVSAGTMGFVRLEMDLDGIGPVTSCVDKPVGSPQRRMSREELEEKFLDCGAMAGLTVDSCQRAFDLLMQLGEASTLGAVLQVLAEGTPHA